MRLDPIVLEPSEWKADLLVLILDKNSTLFDLKDEVLQARIDTLKSEYESGQRESEFMFEPRHRDDIGAVIVYSTEMFKGTSLWENAKTCIYKAIKFAADSARKNIVVALNTPDGADIVSKVAEGAGMATWSFNKYKKDKKDKFEGINIDIATTDKEAGSLAIAEGLVLANAVNMARNIACEPGEIVTPEALALMAKEMSEEFGYEYDEFDEKRLEEEGFKGLLKVGAGSQYPPRMFSLTYTPDEPTDKHLVMVGKGITFDSGGISIKPSANMHEMKADMGGAAAVLGAMLALGNLKPNVKVTAIVCAAENMPDGKAQRPGDIIVYKNGKSVEVVNTDAEGRLVLADGLIHAGEMGATHVIDIATLTGGCVRALGESFTGIMGTNRSLVNAVTQAGGTQGESYWKLPLPIEYKDMLKSQCADMCNSSGAVASAITAGLFLKEFVPERTPWAHLDIAGPSWRSKAWKYYQEGPTGVGVRTLTELAWHWEEYIK